jgi:hypothetical protein
VSSFQLVVTFPFQKAPVFQSPIKKNSFKQTSDTTILFFTNNGDITLTFANQVYTTFVWSGLSLITERDPSTLLDTPTIHNINFLSNYLSSSHPIMRHILIYNIISNQFIKHLYDSFVLAEKNQRFDILPFFANVMTELFRLDSIDIFDVILNQSNIELTISLLEYSNIGNEYQTKHRCFLQQTRFRHILPRAQEQIKPLAKHNYYLSYVSRHMIHFTCPSVDVMIKKNNKIIIDILCSNRTYLKEIEGSIIPVMVALNNKMILSSNANIDSLLFLKELFTLDAPETSIHRLVRKLCTETLILNILEHAFAQHREHAEMIINIIRCLYKNGKTDLFQSVSTFIQTIVNRLFEQHDLDVYIDFLKSFLTTVSKPMICEFINAYFPKICKNVVIHRHNHIHKIYELIGWLFQSYPDVCAPYLNQCVTLFMKVAEYRLKNEIPACQYQLLCMEASRLVYNNVTNVNYLYRTGFIDSVLMMFLSNGVNNMASSVLQSLVCTLTERRLKDFISTHPLATQIPLQHVKDVLQNLSFALSSGIERATKDVNAIIPAPAFVRQNSLECYLPLQTATPDTPVKPSSKKQKNEFQEQLAIYKMTSVMNSIIRKKQSNAFHKWKRSPSFSTEFLMDAVHVMAYKRNVERKQFMMFMLRKNVLPAIRRVYIKESFSTWKTRTMIHKMQHQLIVSSTSSPASSMSSFDDSSPLRHVSFKMPNNASTTSLIGDSICERKDEDQFYMIKHIKNEFILKTNENILKNIKNENITEHIKKMPNFHFMNLKNDVC